MARLGWIVTNSGWQYLIHPDPNLAPLKELPYNNLCISFNRNTISKRVTQTYHYRKKKHHVDIVDTVVDVFAADVAAVVALNFSCSVLRLISALFVYSTILAYSEEK